AYQAGEEVFVHIDKDSLEKHQLTGDIKDVKRDKSILVFAWIFLFVLYLIGKRQGLFAFISLAVNVVLLTYAIEINVQTRSEEHTSELQSRFDLVCRLLLEKKNNNDY